MTVEIFQVLFLDRLLTSCCCAAPHALSSGVKVVDIPIVAQRLFPLAQAVQKTIEILQLQSIEKVVDVTVGHVQQIPRVLSVKTAEIPQLHASYLFLDKVVERAENCEGPAVAALF